jgi:hypothetical protein
MRVVAVVGFWLFLLIFSKSEQISFDLKLNNDFFSLRPSFSFSKFFNFNLSFSRLEDNQTEKEKVSFNFFREKIANSIFLNGLSFNSTDSFAKSIERVKDNFNRYLSYHPFDYGSFDNFSFFFRQRYDIYYPPFEGRLTYRLDEIIDESWGSLFGMHVSYGTTLGGRSVPREVAITFFIFPIARIRTNNL